MRPPGHGLTREIQVGIFIIAACLVVVAFSFRITDTPILRRGTQLVTYLDDATGVFKNSKVKLAGIDIGVIKGIELENGRAKLILLINQGVEIPKDAHIVPRPLGILGDKYLEVVVPREAIEGPESGQPISPEEKGTFFKFEIFPSAWAENGNAKKGAYREGEVIQSQSSGSSLDDITRQMGSVGADLKAVSKELRNIVEDGADSKSPLGRTLKNTEQATQTLNDVLKENRSDLRDLIKALKNSSQKIEKSVEAVDTEQFKKDIKSLAKAVGNVNKSLENVEKITSKIERGEGTLGKLVNDSAAADQLERALRSVNQVIDRAQRTRAIVDLSTDYLDSYADTRTIFSLGLFPREDSGYIGGITSDPFGTHERVVTRTSDNGGPVVEQEVITQNRSALKYSIQYYKRIWNFGLRIGVFENSGGFAFAYTLPQTESEMGFEIYDLSRKDERPHLNLKFLQPFFSYFHVSFGLYEALARSQIPSRGYQSSFTVGIGLRFSDEDLKTLALFPTL